MHYPLRVSLVSAIVLALISNTIYAQTCASSSRNPWEWPGHNNWYIAETKLGTFSGGGLTITTLPTGDTYEGTASPSDDSGNLLFYSNGVQVWSPGGNEQYAGLLAGQGGTGKNSAVQGMIVVKHPLDPDTYHTFTGDDAITGAGVQGFNYFQLNADGTDKGSGGQLLFGSSTEGMAATFHANGVDIWVTIHEPGTRTLHAFLLTCDGVVDTVTTENQASQVDASLAPGEDNGIRGGMKFSADGSRFVEGYGTAGVTILEFDNATGTFSNGVAFGNPPHPNVAYDVEFSPDANRVYVSTQLRTVYSCDISSWNAATIATTWGAPVLDANATGFAHGALEIGPDGNMYYFNQNLHAISGNINAATGLTTSLISGTASAQRIGLPVMFIPPSEEPIMATFSDVCSDGGQIDLSTTWMCSGVDAEDPTLESYFVVGGGPGIVDASSGTFDPGVAGAGTHQIAFVRCNVNDTITITVNDCGCLDTTLSSIPDLCVNGSVDLTNHVVTSENGTWSLVTTGGSNLPDLTGSTFDATNAAPGTYRVRYTLNAAPLLSCADSAERNIVIVDTPTVTLQNEVICQGDSNVTFDAGNAGLNFLWAPDGETTQTISKGAAGTYSVTVTNSTGCNASASADLTVNTLPTLSISGNDETCAGDTTTLTASGAVSYTWAPITDLSVTNQAATVSNPTSDITYTVTGVDANNCSNTTSIEITVNSLPDASITPISPICLGERVTLTASSTITPASYVWSPSDSLSSTTTASTNADPSTTTTYKAIVETDAGCQDSTEITVTVNNPPVVDAGPDIAICPTGTASLEATGASTYIWTPSTDLSDPTIANPQATPSSDITYIVTGTDANGCQDTSEVIVTINATPQISIGPDTSLCAGGSFQLYTSQPMTTHSWTPAGILDNASSANPIATPTGDVTIELQATDASGCDYTAERTITVNEVPFASIDPVNPICLGESTTLTASSTVAASSFSWSPVDSLASPTTASSSANPSQNTTYKAVVTTSQGCQDSTEIVVTVNPLPDVDAGTDVSICPGGTANLSATGANTYVWSPTTDLSDATVQNPEASPSTEVTYLVTGTDGNGCADTSEVTVSIYDTPDLSIGNDTSFCAGDSFVLTPSLTLTTHTWTPASIMSNAAASTPTVTPSTDVTVTLMGTDANGCDYSDNLDITVNPNPTASIDPVNAICEGASTSLVATSSISNATVAWTPSDDLSNAAIPNPTASPATTTLFTVNVTSPEGCTDDASVTLTVHPNPDVDAIDDFPICAGTNGSLSVVGASTYVWSPATGLSSPTSDAPTTSASSTTTYTVLGTDANGCQGTDQVTVTVLDNPIPTVTIGYDTDACIGDSIEFEITDSEVLGPNPSYNWLRVTSDNDTTSLSTASSTVTNLLNQGDQVLLQVISNEICVSPDQMMAQSNALSPTIYAYPDPIISGNDSICLGEIANLSVEDQAGVTNSFEWFIAGESVPYHTGSTYAAENLTTTGFRTYVTATNWNCTTTSPSHSIIVTEVTLSLETSADIIQFDESVSIKANSNASNITWSASPEVASAENATGDELNLTPPYSATYSATATQYSCSIQEDIFVKVLEPISAPYFFSPNGDGNNDLWIVAELQNYPEFDVRIFNRWGSRIKHFQNEMEGWDGTNNFGTPVPDGVYYYVIETTVNDEPIKFSGNVTISK